MKIGPGGVLSRVTYGMLPVALAMFVRTHDRPTHEQLPRSAVICVLGHSCAHSSFGDVCLLSRRAVYPLLTCAAVSRYLVMCVSLLARRRFTVYYVVQLSPSVIL